MFRQTRRSIAVLCLPALVACRGGSNPAAPSDAPVHARGTPRTVVPTGKGIGTRNYSIGPRARYKVEPHNGAVMVGTIRVYFIFYGDWPDGSPEQEILTNYAASINGSSYVRIYSLYPDPSGAAHNGGIMWGRNTVDRYSHGTSLREADVAAIAQQAVQTGQLPDDSNGLYLVVGSSDVSLPGLGETFCALRGRGTSIYQVRMSYGFIGHPARNPGACALQLSGPNGNWAGDAMVYLLGVLMADAVPNPDMAGGWFDRLGLEVGDKCAWDMGPTYQAPNGALANIQLGPWHFLVPRLWVPEKNGGSCVLSLP